MITLWKMFCHAGLSSIVLQEGFQTSWNDNQCGLTYDRISKWGRGKQGRV